MPLFRGQHEHAIDAKGRTSVPAKFRDLLAAPSSFAGAHERLVLTHGVDPCLVAYPMTEWLAFEEKIAKLSQFDRAVQKLRRIYVSGAVECEVDDSGRVLIPPTLRDHAKLAKEVIWAGSGKYAELWDKNTWREFCDTSEEERLAMSQRLAELGL